MKTYPEILSTLRREVKAVGGVKLKMETFSWGAHASFLFTGPDGSQHDASNIAPTWWADEHVAKFAKVAALCATARAELKEIGVKLPGLL